MTEFTNQSTIIASADLTGEIPLQPINLVEETPILPKPSSPISAPDISNIPPVAEAPLEPLLAAEIEPVAATSTPSDTPFNIFGGILGAAAGIGLAASGGGNGGNSNKNTDAPSPQPVDHDKNTPAQPSSNTSEKPTQPAEPVQPAPSVHPTEPPATEPEQIVTKIFYSDGRILSHTSSADQPFNTAGLKLLTDIEQPSDNTSLILPNPADVSNSTYGRDSDRDGLIDIVDSRPNQWDVSERDLRMFSTLAYQSKTTLEKIFSGQSSAINAFDKNPDNIVQTKDGRPVTSVKELVGSWEVLEAGNLDTGLDYTIFGNRHAERESGYDNVVVAFRGSENLDDYTADIKLAVGILPNQAKHLDQVAAKVAAYQADSVYATGHSLGGYLAQYFTAYAMQQQPSWAESMKHSALFNPAKLSGSSPAALDTAIKNTEKFVSETISSQNEASINKTNSYTIKGDWVSEGTSASTSIAAGMATAKAVGWLASLFFPVAGPIIGAVAGTLTGSTLFQGLGKYDNTVTFDVKQSGQHAMSSFYEYDKTLALQKYFSQGTRIDLHYDNPYLKDSDNDGFFDGIEVKLGSNPTDSLNTPYTLSEPAEHIDDRPILAIVRSETLEGKLLSQQAIELSANWENGKLVYTANDQPAVDFGSDNPDFAATTGSTLIQGSSILVGTAGNDILTGSIGHDILIGGAGKDVFVLNSPSAEQTQPDRIQDFNPAEDKLDLSKLRDLFSDHNSEFAWSEVLSDNNRFLDSGSSLRFNPEDYTLAYRASESAKPMLIAQLDDVQQLAAHHIIG